MRLARSLLSALLIGGLPAAPAAAQTSLKDEFDSRELNWRYWRPCQIDMREAPIEFLSDPGQGGDGIVRITVNEASLGGNVCHYKVSTYECRPPAVSLAFVHYDKGGETAREPDLPEPPGLPRPLEKKPEYHGPPEYSSYAL